MKLTTEQQALWENVEPLLLARRSATAASQVRADIVSRMLATLDDASAGAIARVSATTLGRVVRNEIAMDDHAAIVGAAGAEARELVATIREYLRACGEAEP
jgi:hypothetical protein